MGEDKWSQVREENAITGAAIGEGVLGHVLLLFRSLLS